MEVMVAVTLTGILAMVGSIYTVSWVESANVQTTGDLLTQAFKHGQALALRNPQIATGTTPAAGIKLESEVFLVCQGAPTSVDCTASGSSVVWESSHPTGVTVNVNGSTMTVVRMGSSGGAIDGSGDTLTVAFSVSKGDQSETGNLY